VIGIIITLYTLTSATLLLLQMMMMMTMMAWSITAVTHAVTELLTLGAVDRLAEVAAEVGQDQIETFRAE